MHAFWQGLWLDLAILEVMAVMVLIGVIGYHFLADSSLPKNKQR